MIPLPPLNKTPPLNKPIRIYEILDSFCLQIEIDWEKIDAKIEMEYQKERERPERTPAPSTAGGTADRPERSERPRGRSQVSGH